MVSEKIIVILIVVAILLSLVSTVVTLSNLNKRSVPEVSISSGKIADKAAGQVAIYIMPYQGMPEGVAAK
jgi:hypothetical protein